MRKIQVNRVIKMIYTGGTDKGVVRNHNEDSMYIDEEKGRFFIVADGMGGHQGGEVASSMVVEAVRENLEKKLDNHTVIDDPEKKEGWYRMLIEGALNAANMRVYMTAKEDDSKMGMGSTATLAVIDAGTFYIGQIGDSRAYLIDKKEIRQITKDQSFLQKLVDDGVMTIAEARTDRRRNIIQQAVGTREEISVDFYTEEFPGDSILMLCSDGLTDLVDEDAIKDMIRGSLKDLRKACSILIDEANKNGGKDNITVILVHNKKEGFLRRIFSRGWK
ncbi:Stp1/IreP family PP2C-type Ser/Thr phosphatase [candidate division KSB1 bacterium]